MNRKVKVSELRATLGEHLQHVRDGDTITVMDQDTPVAQITPMPAEKPELTYINRADRSKKLGDLKFPPLDPPLPEGVDVVEILLELRQNHR